MAMESDIHIISNQLMSKHGWKSPNSMESDPFRPFGPVNGLSTQISYQWIWVEHRERDIYISHIIIHIHIQYIYIDISVMVIFMVTHISHLYSGDFSSAEFLEHCFHGEPKIIISTTPDTCCACCCRLFQWVRLHWKIRAFDSWELIVGFKSSMFFLLPSWEAFCFPWDTSWLAQFALWGWSPSPSAGHHAARHQQSANFEGGHDCVAQGSHHRHGR